ncbi:hypothetical protein [Streptomyces sp. NPDC059991]|uniref:hypothetical protein n=1 Tax=unclassified Streptomyces TaxID=2593676 RepID=UPI0036863470
MELAEPQGLNDLEAHTEAAGLVFCELARALPLDVAEVCVDDHDAVQEPESGGERAEVGGHGLAVLATVEFRRIQSAALTV